MSRPGAGAAPGATGGEPRAGRPDRGLFVTFSGLWAAVFFAYCSLGAVLPALPPFVRGPLGSDDFAVGLVIGASSVAALVARPLTGYLADARGRRRVMLAGLVLLSVAGCGYLVAGSVPALVATRLVIGLSEACMFTAGSVWVLHIAPSERRGQLLGWYGVSQWTGVATGPLAGAYLLEHGYAAVWAFAATAPLAGAAVCAWLLDTPSPEQPAGPRLLPRAALAPGLALALASSGYVTLASFVVLHLARLRAGSGAVTFAVFAAAYVGTRLVMGHVPDRLGPRRVALSAATVEAAGLLLIAFGTTAWTAAVGALIMGAGLSLVYPSLALLVIDQAPPSERGAAIGTYTSFWDLGVAGAGPGIGMVAAGAGYPAAFATASGCALAAAVLTWAGRASPASGRRG